MRARILNGPNASTATGAAAAKAAGAAAGTVIAPGIGTAIGAAVGSFVASLFPGPSTDWDSAGPGVHEWFTNWGPQAYLDYAKTKPELGILSSVDRCRDGLVAFCWTAGAFGPNAGIPMNGFVVTPDANGISLLEAVDWYTSRTPQIYAAMGVDYAATLQKIMVNVHAVEWTSNRSNVVMLPGAGTQDAPDPVMDALDNAADAVTKGTATAQQQDMVRDALEAKPPSTASAAILPLLLLAGAVLYSHT